MRPGIQLYWLILGVSRAVDYKSSGVKRSGVIGYGDRPRCVNGAAWVIGLSQWLAVRVSAQTV